MPSLSLKAALAYPFRAENRMNAIVIPGALAMGMLLIEGVLSVAAGTFFAVSDAPESLISGLIELVKLPFNLVLALLTAGFTWAVFDHLRQFGLEAPAPDWTSRWRSYLPAGFKMMVLGLAFCVMAWMGILVLFASIAAGLSAVSGHSAGTALILAPIGLLVLCLVPLGWAFTAAPMAQLPFNAPLGGLFRIREWFQMAVSGVRAHGWSLWLKLLGLGLVGALGAGVLIVTVVGLLAIPFWFQALSISAAHLASQLFSEDKSLETAD